MITIYSGVYNEERHIQETIESVLNQTFKDFQFIISDNFSTDTTSQIIDKYVKKDARIIKVSPKYHCPSLEHASFILEKVLPNFSNKYSIHIGGHDLWGIDYLEKLLKRAESNQDISVVYGDVYELNYETNAVIGQLEDHVVISEVIKPLIPHVVLLGLRVNTIVFGLTNEKKRLKASWRHNCSGADHFYVTELALQGKILHEAGAQFFLRRSKDHNSLSGYAKRHLNPQTLNDIYPHRDFYLQLEWASHLVDLAVSDPYLSFYQQPEIKNILKISLINGYIIRYLRNLDFLDQNGVEKFLSSKEIASLYEVNDATIKYLNELITENIG